MVLHSITRGCTVWVVFTLPSGHLPNTFCFISPSICFISPTNLLHFPNKLHRFPNKLLHFPNKMLHFPNQFLISPLQCCVTLPTTFFGLNSVSNDSAHLIPPPIVENSKKNIAPAAFLIQEQQHRQVGMVDTCLQLCDHHIFMTTKLSGGICQALPSGLLAISNWAEWKYFHSADQK